MAAVSTDRATPQDRLTNLNPRLARLRELAEELATGLADAAELEESSGTRGDELNEMALQGYDLAAWLGRFASSYASSSDGSKTDDSELVTPASDVAQLAAAMQSTKIKTNSDRQQSPHSSDVDLIKSDLPDNIGLAFEPASSRPEYGLIIKMERGGFFFGVRFVGCTFDKKTLTLFDNCVLVDVTFINVDFSNIRFLNIEIRDTIYEDCSFTDAICENWKPQPGEHIIGKKFGKKDVRKQTIPTAVTDKSWIKTQKTVEEDHAARAKRG